ncbi:MAG: Si-specific NAD(P)(+) transhydrogenase [Planctomycetes bacterium]|nr:Si-specific NAD(P)(+) transhydrogenase [Planctomycetota bacterium]
MAGETRKYDLIVIGGGPAGIFGATTGAMAGMSVALIDRNHELGGAGINTGTVPSKTLRETALALSGMRSRDLYGVDLSLRREVTIADLLYHERRVQSGLNAMFAQRLEAVHTDLHYGTAQFLNPNVIQVTRPPGQDNGPPTGVEVLHGDNFLIATGSAPVRPRVFPFGPGVYDSDTILELKRLPKSLAVIGAGVIGIEYACTFAALGVEVHVVDGRDAILPFLDDEVSQTLARAMLKHGVRFHLNERAEQCSVLAPGGHDHLPHVALRLTSGTDLVLEGVLVAAGRKSNVQSLDLDAAGVIVEERGMVPVDEHYRTNVPHIYAAGDVIGFPALASTSIEQGRRAVLHAVGQRGHDGLPKQLPHGIYTIPEIGSVGETEQTLRQQGVEIVVGRAFYRDSARGRIIGDDEGFLKLIFDARQMKLLGAHVIGEQATDVVHIGHFVMLAGGGAEMLDDACFNMPTLGALYKFAAFDALRQRGFQPSVQERTIV